jgi:uncharacterized protein (UPF0548 family)
MFLLAQPDQTFIRRFLAAQEGRAFSYREVGATRGAAPTGYAVDHNRLRLGQGREVFARAVAALRSWQMFDTGWTKLCWETTPQETGATVAILIKHCGFWSLNAARIVYAFEENGATERAGFAYGTLPAHAERGEERFSVEFHRADESVWYDLYAFSQPRHWLAQAGYPLARYLQKRFARDSKAAMQRAVN